MTDELSSDIPLCSCLCLPSPTVSRYRSPPVSSDAAYLPCPAPRPSRRPDRPRAAPTSWVWSHCQAGLCWRPQERAWCPSWRLGLGVVCAGFLPLLAEVLLAGAGFQRPSLTPGRVCCLMMSLWGEVWTQNRRLGQVCCQNPGGGEVWPRTPPWSPRGRAWCLGRVWRRRLASRLRWVL